MSGNIDNFSRTDARDSFDPADSFREQPRPEHHLHRESETLPGSDPMGYDQDQTKDTRVLEGRRDIGTGTSFTYLPPLFAGSMRVLIIADRLLGVIGVHQGSLDSNDPSFGQNAFNTERPLDVGPADQGGVAIDGRGDLPEGHANMTDKVIGKVQKVSFCLVPTSWSSLIISFICRSLESI